MFSAVTATSPPLETETLVVLCVFTVVPSLCFVVDDGIATEFAVVFADVSVDDVAVPIGVNTKPLSEAVSSDTSLLTPAPVLPHAISDRNNATQSVAPTIVRHCKEHFFKLSHHLNNLYNRL